jgi:phosphopantothenoylcysteine decarboxylase/phosphopantothenate--cysteine ligase
MAMASHRSRKTRIVLGVTGSIACYKSVELARFFMKRGCDVRVVMTESATKFVAPLTFESLTHNPVAVSFWNETQPGQIGHIQLADWADVVVIAPATADCIAKMALGMGESSLLAVVLATKAPIVVAPAMNVNMFEHPQTQDNLQNLQARGVVVVEPEAGHLACGWKGKGRLAPLREIYLHTMRAIGPQDLIGKRVLISAGPTREAIDPVRYISNRSSGKMGLALANEAFRRGASVTLVHGPLNTPVAVSHIVETIAVTSAAEMSYEIQSRAFDAVEYARPDIIIMAAAVADYRPNEVAPEKMKKSASGGGISLVCNEDILLSLGTRRGSSPKPFLAGFAVETGTPEQVIAEAQRKLGRKSADMVVGNIAHQAFDRSTNQVWIVGKDGSISHIATATKRRIARAILDAIIKALGTHSPEASREMH